MRNNYGRMIGLSIGFDASGAGGGGAGAGAAVAEPPAGGAGAGGSSGSGAGSTGASAPGAGSGGGAAQEHSGFFTNLTKRELPKPAAEGAEGAAGAGEGGAAKTPEELAEAAALELAKGEGKTAEELAAELANSAGGAGGGEGAPTEITEDTVLKTPIYGRFKTIKEANSGFQRSERHGIELAAKAKSLQTQIEQISARHESEMAATRAELELARKTPPFAELTEEQENSLAKDNPSAAIKYQLAKRDHADATRRAKEDAARFVEDRRKRHEAVANEIERDYMEMSADPDKYPLFKQVQPLMDAIHATLGGDKSPLRGDPRAVRLYHRLALGDMYLALLRKGGAARAKALQETKDKAGAGAAATGGVGAGAGAGGGKKPTPAEEDAKKWADGVRQAGPKSFLSNWPEDKK